MIEYKSLTLLDYNDLFTAFSAAFADYEITPDRDELQKMLYRRGFDASLSFGAFDNGKLVSFTCNGIGIFNGIATAYDTGTGTLKDYRGQGLASKVFNESIPYLQKAAIKQYLLEVLQHNEPAVSVYRKMGFKVSREFNYFISESSKLKLKLKKLPADCYLKQINPKQVGDTSLFWDYTPSWQNSFEAIFRKPDDFLITAAFINDQMTGYGILEPSSGDITQLAVHPLHRWKGIGTAILEALLNNNRHSGVKAINTEISSEASTRFFETSGLLLKGKQFEMIKEL